METKRRSNRIGNQVVYSVATVLMLIIAFWTMVGYIYTDAENDAFENLHVQTSDIKEDINAQMISDRENLITMANFAAKLYKDGDNVQLLLDSFKAIGLIENIGILTSDNKFITKVGTIDANGMLFFDEEAKKGQYISGRVKDITTPGKEVIRSAVPVVADETTVAMLYGVIELATLRERYVPMAQAQDAQLFVIERSNGNFIIDAAHQELGNLNTFGSHKIKRGFSNKNLMTDIQNGLPGYTALRSQTSDGYQYIHYAPLNVSDWQIMLSRPENMVFAEARKTGMNLFIIFFVVVIIMLAYLTLMFASERKTSDINKRASKIRKQLLVINQQDDSIIEALKELAQYAKSRSAFFVDTEDENFNYILPALQQKILRDCDKKYFVDTLLGYVTKRQRERNTSVSLMNLYADSYMEKNHPQFYNFMTRHDINNLSIVGIAGSNSQISILGVVNAKRFSGVRALLSDIAICFSMAIYNKKQLNKTELIAMTDSLTRLSNRMAYKNDIVKFNNQPPDLFSCVYIDVNELHMYNNKYGHAAGDSMLCAVSDTLSEIFNGNNIYRMGGDEFLVFTHKLDKETVERHISELTKRIEGMGYHISTGLAFRTGDTDIETLVKHAEKRMYESKAEYYQQKKQKNLIQPNKKHLEFFPTGVHEFDTLLSIASQHYHCVYCVSLDNDTIHQLIMPDYLKKYAGEETSASKVFSRYVHEMVHPDFQRMLLNFLNYDALKNHLTEGNIPSVTYTNAADEIITLSIHSIFDVADVSSNTIWVFEKINER